MRSSTKERIDRRDFMIGASALSAAALLGIPSRAAAEPPPEIKKIRLVKIPALCLAPEYLAEDLLRLEGFTSIDYVEMDRTIDYEMLTENLADMTALAPPYLMPTLDAGVSHPRACGDSRWLLRTVRARECASGSRSERQACGRKCDRITRVLLSGQYGRLRWDGSAQGPRLARREELRRHAAGFCREEGRCILRLPARRARAAREENRTGHREYRAGPALGAILLLHDCRAIRLRTGILSRPSVRYVPFSKPLTSAGLTRSARPNSLLPEGSIRDTSSR